MRRIGWRNMMMTFDDACNGCSAGYNEQSIEKPITSLMMIHSYAINMIFNTIVTG